MDSFLQHGDSRAIDAYIRTGYDVPQEYGAPILKLAIDKGDAALIKTLDESGISRELFEYAVRRGKTRVVHMCLERCNVRPNERFGGGYFALHLAALWAANAEVMEALLARGADVEAKDHQGRTALHNAAMSVAGGDNIAFLLSRMANPNAVDANGRTPMHVSAEIGSAVNMTALEMGGGSVNAVDARGTTPLHLALQVAFVNASSVDFLIERGAKVDAADRFGNTPMHFAAVRTKREPDDASTYRGEYVKTLTLHGADVDAVNELGLTPLHLAALSGSFSATQALAEVAELNELDRNGCSPAYMAEANEHFDVAGVLKASGARVVPSPGPMYSGVYAPSRAYEDEYADFEFETRDNY